MVQDGNCELIRVFLERLEGCLPKEAVELKASPLFGEWFFPWRSLPYPTEYAQLGNHLARHCGARETAEEMAVFQNATLDHTLQPLSSLFAQRLNPEQKAATQAFFEAIEQKPVEEHLFVDHELGLIAMRDREQTIVCTGSGCKSGMGVYLSHDAGVINYGPQLIPVGDCAGFGLAGRAMDLSITQTMLSYRTRLSAPHPRDTGFSHLKDSGYSKVWIETKQEITDKHLKTACTFLGSLPLDALRFIVFGKGQACYIARSHKLNPRSLDRYSGPAQTIEFAGTKGSVSLAPRNGLAHLEVIPLAGDESFWGAEFMAVFTLATSAFGFELKDQER